MCYNILVVVVDAELFEKCGAKNYFPCCGKELVIDTTRALSQPAKCLLTVLKFNTLDVMSENTSEPCILFSEVNF